MDAVVKRAHIVRAKAANGTIDHTAAGEQRQAVDVDPWEGREDGWRPTEPWWHSWHHSLPTSTLVVLHSHLQPLIDQVTQDGAQHWPEVMNVLRGVDLEGVLPPGNPPVKRPFVFGAGVRVWFASYIWALIYAKAGGEGAVPTKTQTGRAGQLNGTVAAAGGGKRWPAPWNGTKVQLFEVRDS
ncbi:hypothetical protein HDU93_000887 [Gonapodya sp. JEL0774]|nr:hypothetical protein HDU93_000887 [Gonapodya sp. JEL0774]